MGCCLGISRRIGSKESPFFTRITISSMGFNLFNDHLLGKAMKK